MALSNAILSLCRFNKLSLCRYFTKNPGFFSHRLYPLPATASSRLSPTESEDHCYMGDIHLPSSTDRCITEATARLIATGSPSGLWLSTAGFTPGIGPGSTPGIGPGYTPGIGPGYTPGIGPVSTPEISPVSTPEIGPDGADSPTARSTTTAAFRIGEVEESGEEERWIHKTHLEKCHRLCGRRSPLFSVSPPGEGRRGDLSLFIASDLSPRL